MRKTQRLGMHIIPFNFNVKPLVDHNNYNIFNAIICSICTVFGAYWGQ